MTSSHSVNRIIAGLREESLTATERGIIVFPDRAGCAAIRTRN
ncbi:hypothetical protein [Paludibacterium yongneupense]|nr:hypothetical protein [Paludibacterium yongneupense]